MKSRLIFSLLFLAPFLSFAQNPLDSVEAFCMIRLTGSFVGKNVQLDYGYGFGKLPKENNKNSQNEEENKEIPVSFDSMVEAMNYLSLQGWSYLNSFGIASENGSATYCIMRKKIPRGELEKQ